MTRTEEIEARMNWLKQMDEYLWDAVGEDVYLDIWLRYGLEDGGAEDKEILREYAEDDSLWNSCVSAFSQCLHEDIAETIRNKKRAEYEYNTRLLKLARQFGH